MQLGQLPVINYDCADDLAVYHQTLQALAGAQRVTVLTGAGISTSAGIPVRFSLKNGLYGQDMSGMSKGNMGSSLFDARALQDKEKLLDYGRTMGALRIACRNASPTPCHAYIARLHELGRLLRCYTQNIDGLQTRGRPYLVDAVLELHGNIHKLRCNRCGQSPDGDDEDVDTGFVSEGYVHCKKCLQRGQNRSNGRKLRQFTPGLLLPQVLHNEGSWEVQSNGMTLDQLEGVDGSAGLLLVIGTSIKTDGAAKLVRSLAKKVHASGGIVAYINWERLQGRKWGQVFDIQLQTEIDTWAADASRHLNKVQGEIDTRREVTKIIAAIRSRDERRALESCQIQESDTRFLHREDSELPSAMARPVSKTNNLVILVCHSGATPFLARAMAVELMGFGRSRGQTCYGYLVILSGSEANLDQIPAPGDYQLIVVHISDYVLRLRDSWRPVESGQSIQELLTQSECAMSSLSAQSKKCLLLMICAEDELLDKDGISRLQQSFERQSTFDTMITGLNISRLRTRSWAKFATDTISSQDGMLLDPVHHIASQWIKNQELLQSSDLVVFSQKSRVAMLLASHFKDRPMGKPLPNINNICSCRPSGLKAHQKEWRVDHNAVDGCAAIDVRVKLRCSACWQTWELDSSRLVGTVCYIEGRFCVLVQYEKGVGWV